MLVVHRIRLSFLRVLPIIRLLMPCRPLPHRSMSIRLMRPRKLVFALRLFQMLPILMRPQLIPALDRL